MKMERPDIYVFTSSIDLGDICLRRNHGAEHIRGSSRYLPWYVLPEGERVEMRSMHRIGGGFHARENQRVHVWNWPDYPISPEEYQEALSNIRIRFVPPTYEGRLHTEVGKL